MSRNSIITYAAVILFSITFLFLGNRLTQREWEDDWEDNISYYAVRVVAIINREETDFMMGWGDAPFNDVIITFTARITTRGERQGDLIVASQEISYFDMLPQREINVGDRIMVSYSAWSDAYRYDGHVRFNHILVLGIVFLVLVIAFARIKGVNAIVALGFTCLAIFLVFIPAILAGRNIYLTTLVICAFAIVSTLLIVIGANKKSLSAIVGCFGGVLTAGLLMTLMDALMQLTGALDRETVSLTFLPTRYPIDLRALLFAGVILGAVGAIMDVAMSIASSLWEIRETGGVTGFKAIVTSGINIGKDILGTMLNTLILAYIGSSMTLILWIVADTTSFTALLNMEMIIVEFLRALVGSFGMLLTIPLTALVCGWLYGGEK